MHKNYRLVAILALRRCGDTNNVLCVNFTQQHLILRRRYMMTFIDDDLTVLE